MHLCIPAKPAFMDFPNILIPAIPGFILLIAAEILYSSHTRKELYEWKDTFSSISLGLGNLATGLVTKGFILALLFWMYQFRIFTVPLAAWWGWILCFLADDFSYYWMHRSSHSIRWFWASHAVHHSSQQYNLAAALRQTWTGSLSGTFIFWCWMPLAGFHPGAILLMQSVSLLYQFWIHTQSVNKLPRLLEFVLNTPSHHRVHHGTNLHYLDRNHGGVLILWDRLFGTFVPEQEIPRYGLTVPVGSFHPVKVAFHEWERLWKDWRQTKERADKWRLLIHAPGWHPEGKTLTTAQLLRKEASGQKDYPAKNKLISTAFSESQKSPD